MYYMTTEIRTETLNLWLVLLLWHAKRFLLQWIAYVIDARKALCYSHVFKYLVSWTENLATKTLMKPNGSAHQLWHNFSWKKLNVTTVDFYFWKMQFCFPDLHTDPWYRFIYLPLFKIVISMTKVIVLKPKTNKKNSIKMHHKNYEFIKFFMKIRI